MIRHSALRKVLILHLILFGALLGAMTYWYWRSDLLAIHPANPRFYQVFRQPRGQILDRHNRVLVETTQEGEQFTRVYNHPSSLSQTIGYFHPRYGVTGLEKVYHSQLTRQQNVYTTLDGELQKFIDELFGDHTGAVVVTDPRTGQILATGSWPGYPNGDLNDWELYYHHPQAPFFNRVLQGTYPPGSVIKPLIMAAALEEGIAELESTWRDTGSISFSGRTIHNSGQRSLGMISLTEALAHSSNVVFAQLANELRGGGLDYLGEFGLGTTMEMELSTAAGRLPSEALSSYGWGQVGIGQSDLLVTPLQIAAAIGVIANNGVLMRPYLVRQIDGLIWQRQRNRPEIIRRVISQATAEQVTRAMVAAVTMGTARRAAVNGLDIAGKTGTAENPQGSDHAWFAGFAPAEHPKVLVVVVVEHGGAGGVAAAPLAREIILKALAAQEER